jgi:hypothetical protein
MKEQFLPNNTSWIIREELKKLKHERIVREYVKIIREELKKLKHERLVREYVKSFSSLILDIVNISEEDRLFNFMSGLQPWAQAELRQ